MKGKFRNTGNVSHAPRTELQVRPVRNGTPGRVALTRRLDAERTEPGKTGSFEGKLDLPGSATSYQLTVRLLGVGEATAARDVSVTPTDRPPILTRATDWVTEHALLLVGLLLVLLATGVLIGTRYVRRLKAETRSS